MDKNRNRKKVVLEYIKDCVFCKEKRSPDFLNVDELTKFISERGKIFSRSRTSLCSKHQSKVTTEIKRARYMALLPFSTKAE